MVTYIQNGNVLFDSEDAEIGKLTQQIEKTLSERFDYNSRIVLVSKQTLNKVVNDAPENFGAYPDKCRYDVIFLKPPFTAEEAFSKIKSKEGVDFVSVGESILYFLDSAANRPKVKLPK